MKRISAHDSSRDVNAAERNYPELGDRRSLVDVLQMDDDIDFEPVISRTLPGAADV